MSKPIASYPQHMQRVVVDRRMRLYNPEGPSGMGVLAAKAQYDREHLQAAKAVAKLRADVEKVEN